MTAIHPATVDAPTAEVRVLLMDARQITLSVYKQLDRISVWMITPFGRVCTGTKYPAGHDCHRQADLELIGTDSGGNLVKAVVINTDDIPDVRPPGYDASPETLACYRRKDAAWVSLRDRLNRLPLIVLAGSR